MRGEAKVTLLQAYRISLPCDTVLWTRIYFYMSALSTSCFVLSAMYGKIKQRVCIKFCMKLGKSTTKTLEMHHEAFGEHALSRTVVFARHSCFKDGRVSVEDDKRSGQPSTSKRTENVEKIQTPLPNNP
jgi:hypothetical protein